MKITPDPAGDTPKRVEDKVRALPENQGLNDFEMWQKIDEEVAEVKKAGKLLDTEEYTPGNEGDTHGKD